METITNRIYQEDLTHNTQNTYNLYPDEDEDERTIYEEEEDQNTSADDEDYEEGYQFMKSNRDDFYDF